MSKTPGFWDASALVPACIHEQATARARLLLRNFVPVIWWATWVEVYGAICRLRREKQINDAGKQSAVSRLRGLSLGWREILPEEQVRDLALACLDRYQLRAADALQLAASLTWCRRRPANRAFITGDVQLAEAAQLAGFSVVAFP